MATASSCCQARLCFLSSLSSAQNKQPSSSSRSLQCRSKKRAYCRERPYAPPRSMLRPLSHQQPLSLTETSILSRRTFSGLALLLLSSRPDLAMAEGAFKEYTDKFDGYSFNYPQSWIQVKGAGADVFFRDPVNLDENVSVEISSPSSSRFKEVDDLGTPDEAARKVLKQYLTEFMSTRLGVRRESKIVSTASRVADDGKLYYEVEVNVKSYANNQQLAVMPQDRIAQLEWDRRYFSVLGVENSRLYELRLQAPEKVLAKEEVELRKMMNSFRVFKL